MLALIKLIHKKCGSVIYFYDNEEEIIFFIIIHVFLTQSEALFCVNMVNVF